MCDGGESARWSTIGGRGRRAGPGRPPGRGCRGPEMVAEEPPWLLAVVLLLSRASGLYLGWHVSRTCVRWLVQRGTGSRTTCSSRHAGTMRILLRLHRSAMTAKLGSLPPPGMARSLPRSWQQVSGVLRIAPGGSSPPRGPNVLQRARSRFQRFLDQRDSPLGSPRRHDKAEDAARTKIEPLQVQCHLPPSRDVCLQPRCGGKVDAVSRRGREKFSNSRPMRTFLGEEGLAMRRCCKTWRETGVYAHTR